MYMEYFKNNPLIAAGLLALAVFAVIVWAKVLGERKKHNAENEALLEKLKEENALRNEFAILSERLAASSDEIRLFRGVSLGLQKRVSDAADTEAEFYGLKEKQRLIYALSFIVEDGGEKLSGFFSINASPLTDEAKKAAEFILPREAYEIFIKEFAAYDPDDEKISFIREEIDKLDESFSALISTDEIMRLGGKYIKENISEFI